MYRFSFLENKLKNKNGYMTLLSVIIVSAVSGSIALTILFSGINASQINIAQTQAAQARSLSNACAEKALAEIRSDTNYEGSNTITFSASNSCEFTIIKGIGNNRTIKATGRSSSSIARIRISIDSLNPVINISNWEEVNAF